MKLIIHLIALCSISVASAQSLTPTVIASTGGHATAGNVTVSYTVGEMAAIETFTGTNNILTQGFHQPEVNIVSLLEAEKTDFGSFAVYPNPAATNVWFGYEFPQEGKVQVTLYNAEGQIVKDVYNESSYTTGRTVEQFDCTVLASGNYMVQATFTGKNGKKKSIAKKLQVVTQ